MRIGSYVRQTDSVLWGNCKEAGPGLSKCPRDTKATTAWQPRRTGQPFVLLSSATTSS